MKNHSPYYIIYIKLALTTSIYFNHNSPIELK